MILSLRYVNGGGGQLKGSTEFLIDICNNWWTKLFERFLRSDWVLHKTENANFSGGCQDFYFWTIGIRSRNGRSRVFRNRFRFILKLATWVRTNVDYSDWLVRGLNNWLTAGEDHHPQRDWRPVTSLAVRHLYWDTGQVNCNCSRWRRVSLKNDELNCNKLTRRMTRHRLTESADHRNAI